MYRSVTKIRDDIVSNPNRNPTILSHETATLPLFFAKSSIVVKFVFVCRIGLESMEYVRIIEVEIGGIFVVDRHVTHVSPVKNVTVANAERSFSKLKIINNLGKTPSSRSVSYTHLTLPTNREV